MTKLVPFGKYKGQPIETLAQDSDYCEWLAGQDWFRTRYTAIHTLIVNNFAEPHETPEHNALQVLFTDPAWVTAFVWAYLGPTWWAAFLKKVLAHGHRGYLWSVTHIEDDIKSMESQSHPQTSAAITWRSEYVAVLRAKIDTLRGQYDRYAAWLNSGLVPVVRLYKIAYEQEGADVAFSCDVGVMEKDMPEGVCVDMGGTRLSAPDQWLDVRVECKPALGDDYPAVLRQMIAHKSNVLLIGHGGYQGIGATFEQMTKIFGASGIKVIELSEVTA